ncbi:MAG: glycosyltransferase family 2 protein [Deltaproteobacteria bacterium]|nr:glycosyltransferase family 2 protein [Candidatus Zymogenaceae bacterium]
MEQTVSTQGLGSQKEAKKIVVLIPALNAGPTIGDVVSGARKHIPDVLVVDDGSIDETGPVAQKCGARVVSHKTRMGKGAALRTGFAALTGDKSPFDMPDGILTMDADGQHDPDDIPRLVSAFEEGRGDLIFGSRMGQRDNIPTYRLWPNLVGNFFLSRASGNRVDDSQSGMRIYSRTLLSTIRLSASRFDLEAEAIIRSGKAGFRFCFVPIRAIYMEDHTSNFRPVLDTFLISMIYLRSIFWRRGDVG